MTHTAKHMSGLIHNMVYTRLPTANAYGILLYVFLLSILRRLLLLEILTPCLKGKNLFLEFSMLNQTKILSINDSWDKTMDLFVLSQIIWIPST